MHDTYRFQTAAVSGSKRCRFEFLFISNKIIRPRGRVNPGTVTFALEPRTRYLLLSNAHGTGIEKLAVRIFLFFFFFIPERNNSLLKTGPDRARYVIFQLG